MPLDGSRAGVIEKTELAGCVGWAGEDPLSGMAQGRLPTFGSFPSPFVVQPVRF